MVSKLRLVFSISILFLSFYGSAQQDIWKEQVAKRSVQKHISKTFDVQKARVYSIDQQSFVRSLVHTHTAKNNTGIVRFPDQNGQLVAYVVSEAAVLSAALAKKYPSIRSYVGHGLKNKKDKIRFSVSHNGIQAMMVYAGSGKNVYLQKAGDDQYVVYSRESENLTDKEFICNTNALLVQRYSSLASKPVDGQVLRKFRLAVSASGEYTAFHGGTIADALAAINATVTRVNQVFESDLGVTLELVADNDKIIYTDGETDPYGGNLNGQIQGILNDSIGAQNYDIGHLFHKVQSSNENGGNAGFIGAVCADNKKGSAYSSSVSPVGDTFDLDYVAHEMGHQFGANHTWSFESEGTQVQAEPGSGTTIMGYAGITGVNNVALNGDDYFHYYSILQISDYLETVSCAETINLVNTPPVIVPTGNFTIPKSTAFALTGQASDVDVSDVLTFAWEQIDDGVVTQATFGPTNPSGANFRSQKPTTDPTRYFPSLSHVLTGDLTQTSPAVNTAWETVSDVEREMNFAFTVRDNGVGGGQVVSDLMSVSVVSNAGPFRITSQTTSQVYTAGTVQNISWDVANTDKAPIGVQNVDIVLSTDGGLTFPITLADNIANDGDHEIVLPGVSTTMARIMIRARDNVFFAVNDAEFTIEQSEIVLNFSELEYFVCQPDDLVTTFEYETYLGFSEEVTFSVPTPPLGLNVSFSPTTATTNTTVTVTFSNTTVLPESLYTIEVLATSASMDKQVALDLNIYDAVFPDVSLNAPADGGVDISAKTFLEWEDVPSYSSYTVEIADDMGFGNIIETSTVSSNVYSPLNLNNEATYYWRVKPMNVCGEGSFSSPYSFTTIEYNCDNNMATDLPLAISANGTPTVITKIPFYEDLALADINVNLELDHTYLADLVVKLTSPAGTSVILISSSCGELQNINATFDDDAPIFVCDGDPALSGMIRPLGALSSFQGESILGEWILEINDNAASDGGSVRNFSLDICVEGGFRPDDDDDGVFDDGDDLCLGTPLGTEVDETGCPVYRFDNNNFSISLNSETCRDNNNGSINITAIAALDYDIAITGTGVDVNDSFTDSYMLGNLMSGTYQVCIDATEDTKVYETHCFEVVITQPSELNISSITSLNGNNTLLMLQGAEVYNIELNGVVSQTTASEITVDLKKGNNTLRVYSNLRCQGVYEEQIFLSETPIVYPNPFETSTNIHVGTGIDRCLVQIFDSGGRLEFKKSLNVSGTSVFIDLSMLSSGVHYMKISSENLRGTTKIIKR